MVSTIRHRKPSLEEEIKDVELRAELEGEQETTSKSVSEQQQSEMGRRSSSQLFIRVLACLVITGAGYLLIDKLSNGYREDNVPILSYKRVVQTLNSDGLLNGEPGRELLNAAGRKEVQQEGEELEADPAKMADHVKVAPPEKDHERTMRYHNIWEKANNLITKEHLWPSGPEVDQVLEAMRTARIVNVDILDIGYHESGTSEKWLIMLEGGQKAMMKVSWEAKGRMKPGALCNYGFEMASSEVAGFNLQRVLNMRNTPYVTGRKVDIMTELLPAATPHVARQIIIKPGESCIVGRCFHCTQPHTICPQDGKIEASIAYWIPRHLKLYTEQPKYMPYSTPNADDWGIRGFNDRTYCNQLRPAFYPYENDRFYYDLFDFAVVDTLMYHYDSKHYMVHDESDAHGLTIRLDHGRSFCANDRDDFHIFLAPLFQCCTLRMKTWQALVSLKPGDLTKKLKKLLDADPIAPVLEPAWYPALERRLAKIKETMKECAKANKGFEHVLVEKNYEENH